MVNYLIIGANESLGTVFSQALPAAGDVVWLAARQAPPPAADPAAPVRWIPADLSQRGAGAAIAQHYTDPVLDVCVFAMGDWPLIPLNAEDSAGRLMANQFTSAIVCVQKLLPNLRRSGNPRVVFTGQGGLPEALNDQNVFGLRGVANALREVVRRDHIGVTFINLGQPLPEDPSPAGLFQAPAAATVDDLLAVLRCVISLSPASCVRELDLLAMQR
jgi:NAD(P)-dependent dehydrogenase (short-subunit alcohol dehydrogenase family)